MDRAAHSENSDDMLDIARDPTHTLRVVYCTIVPRPLTTCVPDMAPPWSRHSPAKTPDALTVQVQGKTIMGGTSSIVPKVFEFESVQI
jgi:hypothetical protein